MSLQCVCDGVCETGIFFLFQFYMLVFVNLYMYIFVVREGLMEDKLLLNVSPSRNNVFFFIIIIFSCSLCQLSGGIQSKIGC